MRKRNNKISTDYRILIVDDEEGIIDSLSVVLKRNGYYVEGEQDPIRAIEKVRDGNYNLMILDYLMYPIHGDKVVEEIRKFNKELYILLLTGHKDLAPPLDTIKALEIQGYCEKGDRFDQLLLLVESGIKSISQMNTIKKFQEGLNKILLAVPKIYQLQPVDNILEGILREILPLINSRDAFILVDDITNISNVRKSIFKGIGKYDVEIDEFMEMLDPSFMEHIGMSRVKKEVVNTENGTLLPLLNEYQQTIGIIYVEISPSEYGIRLLKIYSSQAASSVNNAFLHSLVNVKNEELNRTYEQLKQRYLDTIEALRLVVDAKDIYTRGHSDRVSFYAVKIGEIMGLPEDELEKLRIGGFFHDIGKIGTADDILLKNEKLSGDEYDEIKKHPIKGAHILSAVSMFRSIVPIVRYHHEWVNGKGYPDGLKGDEIPLLAKIVAVVDAFDAMISDRQYRSRLDLDEAKNQLVLGAGKQFDEEIVKIFMDILSDYSSLTNEIRNLNYKSVIDDIDIKNIEVDFSININDIEQFKDSN